MNEIQAIRMTNDKRLMDQIRKDMVKIRKFYKDYPFCKLCGCRMPTDHSHSAPDHAQGDL